MTRLCRGGSACVETYRSWLSNENQGPVASSGVLPKRIRLLVPRWFRGRTQIWFTPPVDGLLRQSLTLWSSIMNRSPASVNRRLSGRPSRAQSPSASTRPVTKPSLPSSSSRQIRPGSAPTPDSEKTTALPPTPLELAVPTIPSAFENAYRRAAGGPSCALPASRYPGRAPRRDRCRAEVMQSGRDDLCLLQRCTVLPRPSVARSRPGRRSRRRPRLLVDVALAAVEWEFVRPLARESPQKLPFPEW